MLDFFLLKKKRETQGEFLKFCTFILEPEEGTLLSNGSFTGATGLIQRNKAHVKSKADNVLMDGQFTMSNVCNSLVSSKEVWYFPLKVKLPF